MLSNPRQLIFEQSLKKFEKTALNIFKFQAENNPVYKKYLKYTGRKAVEINNIPEIPFLPVDFFKSHHIVCGNKKEEIIFTSSGTTGSQKSKHFIVNTKLYEESFSKTFKMFYGDLADYCMLGLLPNMDERKDSSLVYMVKKLIELTNHPISGFYLDDIQKLTNVIKTLEQRKQKTILLGLSYALLDFAEKTVLKLSNTIVMETGGMKGRREEITKTGLHDALKKGFGVQDIHSEYGMTELLSQAYSKGNGKYFCPPWMKILIRDPYDPFNYLPFRQSGGINIIDLANLHSCSFIETKDLGKLYPDGSFEVLGRIDHSEIRGCNLMMGEV
ncbi:MAG: acyl transferase [Bacteroidota bacterium]